MKILIVSNFLPPKIGGIERHSHEFANELSHNQFSDVTVLCASWPEKLHNFPLKNINRSYKTIYIPSFIIGKRLPIPNIFSFRFWVQFFKLPRDFDFVFFQSHLFVLNWFLAIHLRSSKRRIWMNHGCNFVPVGNSISTFLSKIYELIGMNIMKLFCNEYFAQSINAANWISSKTHLTFEILPNAINLNLFNNLEVNSDSKTEIKVLYVGRFVVGKGLIDCIKIVADANELLISSRSIARCKLIIIGSGPLQADAEELILRLNLKAQFMGELGHERVIEEMCNSRFLVQYYDRPEGMPTVALEAIACGMLVFTTPVGGPGELDDCKNFKVGLIETLPTLMANATLEVKKRGDLVSEGRNFIESGWSWETVAKKIMTLERK